MFVEVNFDGLVGPTHHYGGLGVGNIASLANRTRLSHPRAAALEGLEKAWLVAQLGVPQVLLPPLVRPNRALLRGLGFEGVLAEQLKRAAESDPTVLSAAMSASAMWTANAATVSPSSDCEDGKLHITPANLISSLHRGQEAGDRTAMFRYLWRRDQSVVVHDPLPAILPMRDEGAANHLRITNRTGERGCEIFVSGDDDRAIASTTKFIVRQTRQSMRVIARCHHLRLSKTFFLQQSPIAIDAGVFHNDVISTAHEHVWFYHEDAFVDSQDTLDAISKVYRTEVGSDLVLVRVDRDQLPLEEAVKSYLFNSQLVTLPKNQADGPSRIHLICPSICSRMPNVQNVIAQWQENRATGIEKVHYVSLDESMANGGGPACLRLRIVLSMSQKNTLPQELFLNQQQYDTVREWILKWYPETITLSDLANAKLAEHCEEAIRQYPYRRFFIAGKD
jgi:succinylarginine dihydrolase